MRTRRWLPRLRASELIATPENPTEAISLLLRALLHRSS